MRCPIFQISENRTGYILATVNASLWILAIWERGGVDSRGFHPYNESLLLLALLTLNFPALLIVGIVLIPSVFVLFGGENDSSTVWVQALLVMIGTSFQWLIIGFFAGNLKRRIRNKDAE